MPASKSPSPIGYTKARRALRAHADSDRAKVYSWYFKERGEEGARGTQRKQSSSGATEALLEGGSWLLLCVSLFAAVCAGAQSYPPVAAINKTFEVQDLKKADVSLNIQSPEGTPLYRLQCHSAGYAGDPDFDYSGDFECRLSTIGHRDRYSTLLTEDRRQSRDWESRGRFFSQEVGGICASIRDFGATRTFQLRGMNLTLQIIEPLFAHASLKALKLRVIVQPNPQARHSIARIVPLPKRAPAQCELKENFVDLASFRVKSGDSR